MSSKDCVVRRIPHIPRQVPMNLVQNQPNYRVLNIQIQAVYFDIVLRLLAKNEVKSRGSSNLKTHETRVVRD